MKAFVATFCILMIAAAHCTDVAAAQSPLQGKLASAAPTAQLGGVNMEECKELLYKFQDYLNIIDSLETQGKYVPKDLYEERERLEEKLVECAEHITL